MKENAQPAYEYCPRCDANLTLQKGYHNDLPYWICKGCGEMLINPEVYAPSDITWICDGCGAMLNIQPGFHEDCGNWNCTVCGSVNPINAQELYLSEDEYQAELNNPYKGLSDDAVFRLSEYVEVQSLDEREHVFLVKSRETGQRYVKKLLRVYDQNVYEYLAAHPIGHMPKIVALFESDTCLIVIEEYIEGKTVADLLKEGAMPAEIAAGIVKSICVILTQLHHLPKPIVHRDIKPTNVIIRPDGDVYLLDMNAAKWYDAEKTDDTRYMGTEHYAAPEQVGYGFAASSAKSDIYALGMLFNVMLTGEFPKQKKADGPFWPLIKRCISLEAEQRYTAEELLVELEAAEAAKLHD